MLDRIAACGSFSGAAETLQMTQSAVSQHVAALERALGLPLVERGTRPVQLTDAGFALVRHAQALMTQIGNAEQELGEITGRRTAGYASAASRQRWPPSSRRHSPASSGSMLTCRSP